MLKKITGSSNCEKVYKRVVRGMICFLEKRCVYTVTHMVTASNKALFPSLLKFFVSFNFYLISFLLLKVVLQLK